MRTTASTSTASILADAIASCGGDLVLDADAVAACDGSLAAALASELRQQAAAAGANDVLVCAGATATVAAAVPQVVASAPGLADDVGAPAAAAAAPIGRKQRGGWRANLKAAKRARREAVAAGDAAASAAAAEWLHALDCQPPPGKKPQRTQLAGTAGPGRKGHAHGRSSRAPEAKKRSKKQKQNKASKTIEHVTSWTYVIPEMGRPTEVGPCLAPTRRPSTSAVGHRRQTRGIFFYTCMVSRP